MKSLFLFENKRGQVKKPMLFFYLLFTAHCVMMHWKSHSQVFTRLDDAGERRWATAANPTQGRRNVGNFGGPIMNNCIWPFFFPSTGKGTWPIQLKFDQNFSCWGSTCFPEDPTRPEIGFKLGSFGFYFKSTIFMLNPILNLFSG